MKHSMKRHICISVVGLIVGLMFLTNIAHAENNTAYTTNFTIIKSCSTDPKEKTYKKESLTKGIEHKSFEDGTCDLMFDVYDVSSLIGSLLRDQDKEDIQRQFYESSFEALNKEFSISNQKLETIRPEQNGDQVVAYYSFEKDTVYGAVLFVEKNIYSNTENPILVILPVMDPKNESDVVLDIEMYLKTFNGDPELEKEPNKDGHKEKQEEEIVTGDSTPLNNKIALRVLLMIVALYFVFFSKKDKQQISN